MSPSALSIATGALVVTLDGARGLAEDPTLIGWRSGGPVWWSVHLERGESMAETKVHHLAPRRFAVEWAEERVELELLGDAPGEVSFLHDGVRRTVAYALDGDAIWLDDGAGALRFTNTTHRAAQAADAAGSGRLTAPLDGSVTELAAAVGDTVEKGQLVLVLEAMKMEHRIVADVDGTVAELLVSAGQQVKTRQLLAQITPS